MFLKTVLFHICERSVSRNIFLHTSPVLSNKGSLVLSTTKKHVTTLTLNNPTKLNGWTLPMLDTLFELFDEHAADENTKVVILTGSDPYYCAGANLSENIKPMHPKKLHQMITESNAKLFNYFIDFPKPILVAANGPAIGASVTSAALCDGIIASHKASFLTPFARLAVPAEGCSSVHFERILGAESARKMIGEGWKVSAEEAKEIGLILQVVPHNELMTRAQELAENWVKIDKKRTIPDGGNFSEYREINAYESVQVADAFLSYRFLDTQYRFLVSKGKVKDARVFWILKTLHPLWSRML